MPDRISNKKQTMGLSPLSFNNADKEDYMIGILITIVAGTIVIGVMYYLLYLILPKFTSKYLEATIATLVSSVGGAINWMLYSSVFKHFNPGVVMIDDSNLPLTEQEVPIAASTGISITTVIILLALYFWKLRSFIEKTAREEGGKAGRRAGYGAGRVAGGIAGAEAGREAAKKYVDVILGQIPEEIRQTLQIAQERG